MEELFEAIRGLCQENIAVFLLLDEVDMLLCSRDSGSDDSKGGSVMNSVRGILIHQLQVCSVLWNKV